MDSGHIVHTPEWRSWVASQLADAGYEDESATAQRLLIEAVLMATADISIDVPGVRHALSTALSLLEGKALTEEHWTAKKIDEEADARATWIPVTPGMNIQMGMTARVRSDAYELGTQYHRHNGKAGKVVGLRRGVVSLWYPEDPLGVSWKHQLTSLELRIS